MSNADRVWFAASRPLTDVASTARLSCRSDTQSSTRNVNARATLSPLSCAAAVRLDDADVVNNTANTTINGNDTNNIAATNRNANRR